MRSPGGVKGWGESKFDCGLCFTWGVESTIAVFSLISIVFMLFAIVKKKKGSVFRRKRLALLTCVSLLFALCISAWLLSHLNHPEINDWEFLGKNIAR